MLILFNLSKLIYKTKKQRVVSMQLYFHEKKICSSLLAGCNTLKGGKRRKGREFNSGREGWALENELGKRK